MLAMLSLQCRSVASMVDARRLTLLLQQLRLIRLKNPFLTMTVIRECVPVLDPMSSKIPSTARTTNITKMIVDEMPFQLPVVRLDIENDTVGYRSFEIYGLHCFLKTPAAGHLRKLEAPNMLYAERWDVVQWPCKDGLEILAVLARQKIEHRAEDVSLSNAWSIVIGDQGPAQ
ncbi:hypothetical protein DFQ27_003019 [Actinomortierella ambigua]|uniref:Uncharacterized protein n=1 Tax=Actinomortierella ambigua TaxID=1343610 RepID=A0A9P6UCU4_9FUNG|nr:hypothetical protein DFQ27_003019 [Actinomortierella ambigua]